MKVGLVSPYSWTYPGGVTRHIESLAGELRAGGHDVRVLAPFDEADRAAALRHRGVAPQERERPEWLIPLDGTIGWPFNGAMSNIAGTPTTLTMLRTAIARERFDVLHLHEPVAPLVGWDTLTSAGDTPLVGTFHCYGTARGPHNIAALLGARRKLNRLHVRIAVSEAAAWTGKRFYGGEYRIVPNGVELPAGGVPAPRLRAAGEPLRIVFIGQAVERKGLPLLLRAFEALREQVPVELTLVGVDAEQVAPLLVDARGVRALGRVDDAEKQRVLAAADVLCAPSLGGESFGMVLTEGFAAGAAVVASDIPGYAGVVTDGVDGLLVPRGDATALAEALRDLAIDPARCERLAQAGAARSERYAWRHVAAEVVEAYEDARALAHAPAAAPTPARRAALRLGIAPASGGPRVPAQRRLPSLEPAPVGAHRPTVKLARRAAVVGGALGALGLTYAALSRIGLESIGRALLDSSPTWVLIGLALMCSSMLVRAVAWHAILKAALPRLHVRLADAVQGTCIGVLMSATLPARLGEPARALVVARRVGQARAALPAVTGSLVAQTLLNVLALLILGGVMFATVGLFAGRQQALLWYSMAPIAIVLAVLCLPALLRSGLPSRSERVHRWMTTARHALSEVRSGLSVFRRPKLGSIATSAQLGAWGIQWLSCYVLLVALGLDDQAGIGAAAAVLFAVNVSAVLPITPSNLGVFQAACVAVLAGAYGVSTSEALAYGIVLQAVEIATAVIMGTPALIREGVSWREIRMRAMHTSPVELRPLHEAQPERSRA